MAPSVSSGFPSCRVPRCDSGPDSKLVFKGKFEVFLFSSFSLFFPSGQRKISQGQAPWRRRGLPSTGGFPSGLSDLVSSLAISSEGERNRERKTTEPFSSLRLPREGTERLCLSGEKREEQVGRSRAGQQQRVGFGLSPPVKQSFALDPRKQGQRARYLHVPSFKFLKNAAPFQVLPLSPFQSRNESGWAMALVVPKTAGVEERPGSGKKSAAGRELAEQAGDPVSLGSVPGSHHRPPLTPVTSSPFRAWGAGKAGVSLVAGDKGMD